MMIRTTLTLATTLTLVACSGGGGSGSSSSSEGPLQIPKASCNGQGCISTSSIVPAAGSPLDDAGATYTNFNNVVIPAVNKLIKMVETGAANAGAESCSDISLTPPGDEISVNIDGSIIYAKVFTSSLLIPSGFYGQGSGQYFDKQISAKATTSDSSVFINVDFKCNAGTDTSPLVARVVAENADGQKINAYYQKGSKVVRIEMVANMGGGSFVKARFNTTGDGKFTLTLANTTKVYNANGDSTAQLIHFNDGTSTYCLSETGSPDCSALPLTTPADIVDGLISSARTWDTTAPTMVAPAW